MELLQKTLNGLKKRLEKDNKIYIQHTEGLVYEVTCDFKAPASTEEIRMFEEQIGWNFPQDYKEFLLLHNGANLLYEPGISGGIELYSIEEILNEHKLNEEYSVFAKEFYCIGKCKDGDILIDARKYKPNQNRDSNYLFWNTLCSPEEDVIDLQTNFELWLDRIIAAQGDDYWNWSIFSADNYYKYK